MKTKVIYRYMGTNGIIESPVHLEDVYYIRLLDVTADEGKLLTNGDRMTFSIRIPEDELTDWHEIDQAKA